jgi:hypothetical protein
MLENLLFRFLSESNQISILRSKGKILRTHISNGRIAYLYLLKNLYVEVIHYNDNSELPPERVRTFESMEAIDRYLRRQGTISLQ